MNTLRPLCALIIFITAGTASRSVFAESWDDRASTGVKALNECRYDEAERILKQLDTECQQFDAKDERRATSANNLAALYYYQGKLPDATEYFQKAVTHRLKENKTAHPFYWATFIVMGDPEN